MVYTGKSLQHKRQKELTQLATAQILRWPTIALIVPISGNDPRTDHALRSLLTQDYPAFIPVFVTQSATEPAANLVSQLKRTYPKIQHVTAGPALNCGQKNHNLLRGVAAVEALAPDCYVFCDCTHVAQSNFLQALVAPIARGETRFSTGYHEVVCKDSSATSIGYAICVLFMRLLQALSVFTQPWGGAMAIWRETFTKGQIGALWSKTVVDDCALVPHLRDKHIQVQLARAAVLQTPVEHYQKEVWQAWMDRQILFPKFCVPSQWWLLGIFLMLMLVPPILVFEDLVLSLQHGFWAHALLGGSFFAVYVGLIMRLARYLSFPCKKWSFFKAFFVALGTFFHVYMGTFWTQTIHWQGKLYTVGRGGIVLKTNNLH